MMVAAPRLLFALPLMAFLFAAGPVTADETLESDRKVSIGGYSFWQLGQIVKGNDRVKGPINHAWLNDVLIGLTFKAQPSENLSLVVNPEFNLSYPFPQEKNFVPSVRPFGSTTINEAYGKFLFGDSDNPLLSARLGMFLYKYSREVRNLGDYMFRTGTFPTYIINYFDLPAARLLGLCLSSDFIPNLHADLLVTSEYTIFPFGDFSLAGIASYRLFDAIELGGGIDLARIFPIDIKLTSPESDLSSSTYPNLYITSTGDTGYYSFQATKVMARASIDVKKLLGLQNMLGDIFGEEDMKLYGEICMVGIEGYDDVYSADSLLRPWYHNLNERTPRMLGFNVPALKLLDVCAAELEYFPSVLPNDYGTIMRDLSPMPYFMGGLSSYKKEDWDKGAWRWSIYARKMVIQGFSVIGQVAFDHFRTMSRDVGAISDYECLTRKGHWHWKMKFSYDF